MADAWTVEVFRDRRGQHPVIEFLDAQATRDVAKVQKKVRILRERTRHERPERIGRPLVDTLDAPIKELRATDQIRILFAFHYEKEMILLLEADRKKNGTVDDAAIARAKRNLDEWLATGNSDPWDDLL